MDLEARCDELPDDQSTAVVIVTPEQNFANGSHPHPPT
jgi:hypothetical protein